MNNKIKPLVLVVTIAVLALVTFFIFNILNPNVEKLPYVVITDKSEISKIVTDSFLDILVEGKNYSSSEINYEEMLKATMRISRELNLLKEMSTETNFYEYVPENTIHTMISELTDKKVSNPIKVEDFYYLYNETEKYYYVVPVGTDWIHINDIKEVRNVNDGEYYTVICSVCISEDGITTYNIGDVTTTLKHCPENKYIRYQLVNMEYTKQIPEEI